MNRLSISDDCFVTRYLCNQHSSFRLVVLASFCESAFADIQGINIFLT